MPVHYVSNRGSPSPARPCRSFCRRIHLLPRKRRTVFRFLGTSRVMDKKNSMKSIPLGNGQTKLQAQVQVIRHWAGQLDGKRWAHPSIPSKQQQARRPLSHRRPLHPLLPLSKTLPPTFRIRPRLLTRTPFLRTLRAKSISQ